MKLDKDWEWVGVAIVGITVDDDYLYVQFNDNESIAYGKEEGAKLLAALYQWLK